MTNLACEWNDRGIALLGAGKFDDALIVFGGVIGITEFYINAGIPSSESAKNTMVFQERDNDVSFQRALAAATLLLEKNSSNYTHTKNYNAMLKKINQIASSDASIFLFYGDVVEMIQPPSTSKEQPFNTAFEIGLAYHQAAVALYNSALTHHLRALDANSIDSHKAPCLDEQIALELYKRSFDYLTALEYNVAFSATTPIFTLFQETSHVMIMAIFNNTGHIHHVLGRNDLVKGCMEHLSILISIPNSQEGRTRCFFVNTRMFGAIMGAAVA